MSDIVPPEKRHEMMSGIRSENTSPEIEVRRWLYHNGIRYRLHVDSLCGTPDIVVSRLKVAIFVNGCFWHRHSGCKLAYVPKSNCSFWQEKFRTNVERDRKALESLESAGWRVIIVWECQVRNGSYRESLLRELCQSE